MTDRIPNHHTLRLALVVISLFILNLSPNTATAADELNVTKFRASPHAYDVMLASQLGIGAYRALVEEKLDGHMVSVSGQLQLHYVPFKALLDPDTLGTEVRYIPPGSDFHRLARFLETRVDSETDWTPGRRRE